MHKRYIQHMLNCVHNVISTSVYAGQRSESKEDSPCSCIVYCLGETDIKAMKSMWQNLFHMVPLRSRNSWFLPVVFLFSSQSLLPTAYHDFHPPVTSVSPCTSWIPGYRSQVQHHLFPLDIPSFVTCIIFYAFGGCSVQILL